MINFNAKKFQSLILKWFDQHGRKTLPWQQNKTPYRVWISEIMLQQTQVSTVIPYYQRFMERFPTLLDLANAQEDEVLHLWTGLGYYSRARNLHKTAKILAQQDFPSTLAELENLPGIGRSTAGAILAIAFEKNASILDGNVKRVLTRFHAIQEWPGDALTELWQLAEKYTPTKRIADYTQAMMDLGATLCKRGKPLCEHCPLQDHCQAHALQIEMTLPRSKPRKQLPVRSTILLMVRYADTIFLEKRPPMGIWAGLWSFPEISNLNDVEQLCAKRFGKLTNMRLLPLFRHTFSHFHLDILPAEIVIQKRKNSVMDDAEKIWYNLRQPATVGLPAPIKLLLEKINHDSLR